MLRHPYNPDLPFPHNKKSEEYVLLRERVKADIERLKIASVLLEYSLADIEVVRARQEAPSLATNA